VVGYTRETIDRFCPTPAIRHPYQDRLNWVEAPRSGVRAERSVIGARGPFDKQLSPRNPTCSPAR
jgi:hypothetical protein